MQFLKQPKKDLKPEDCQIGIVPIPYEATTSYLKGTQFGPEQIIKASENIELFDPLCGEEICKHGIYTFPAITTDDRGPAYMVAKIEAQVTSIAAKYPQMKLFFLGGEHTITIGIVKALQKCYSNNACSAAPFSILYLDAHADLRHTYQESTVCHATVARRLLDGGSTTSNVPIFMVGIRSISKEEIDFIKSLKCSHRESNNIENRDKKPQLEILWAHEWLWSRSKEQFLEKVAVAPQALGNLLSLIPTEKVYLSLDLDVFDPSFMPAVGTPEPGGIGFYDYLDLIQCLCQNHHIIGMDMVEYKPISAYPGCDCVAASILYKTMGFAVAPQAFKFIR